MMQHDRPLNREYTKEELESKKPKRPKINIDDYKPSGNLYKNIKTKDGRRLNYAEPSDAQKPTDVWKMYSFDGKDEPSESIELHDHSFYIIGRDKDNVDVYNDDKKMEGQQAVIQFRQHGNEVFPYIIDITKESKTIINKRRIESNQYVELLHEDMIRFEGCVKEYIILNKSELERAKRHKRVKK